MSSILTYGRSKASLTDVVIQKKLLKKNEKKLVFTRTRDRYL